MGQRRVEPNGPNLFAKTYVSLRLHFRWCAGRAGFDAEKRDANLFERRAAVTDQGGVFLYERFAVRCEQCRQIFRQAIVSPLERIRELIKTGFAERGIGVNTATLAALVAEDSLLGVANADRLGVVVVGRNEHIETERAKVIEQTDKKTLLAPSANLSGHTLRAKLHPVHDLVHLEQRDAQGASLRCDYIVNLGEIVGIAMHVGKGDFRR